MDKAGSRIISATEKKDRGELSTISDFSEPISFPPSASSPLVRYKRHAEKSGSSASLSAKEACRSPGLSLIPATRSPGNLVEAELKVRLRRIQAQERQQKLERKQLETEAKKLEYQLQLGRIRKRWW